VIVIPIHLDLAGIITHIGVGIILFGDIKINGGDLIIGTHIHTE
jgi:hypothetical protein